MGRSEPLADGTRVLHIGPPKTATTSVQAAIHAARAELAEHGIAYAGRTRHSRAPATAIARENLGFEFTPAALKKWDKLAAEVRESTARITVLSSEGLSLANVERARKIVDDIGGSAHVVITMRPLARMIPSIWQQRVRRGSAQSLDDYVAGIFDRDEDGRFTNAYFWGRYGLDQLVTTWAQVVGEENISVVILDPRNHDLAYHAFEDLLGVPRGVLKHEGPANESFPFAELEVIRQFSEHYFAGGGTRKEWFKIIRQRDFREFREPGSAWLTGRKADISRDAAKRANDEVERWIEFLDGFEGRLVGDPADLLVDLGRYDDVVAPDQVSTASAAQVAYAVYDATRRHAQQAEPETSAESAPMHPAYRSRVAGAKRRLSRAWAALQGR